MLAMRLTPRTQPASHGPILRDLHTGWRYVVDSVPIRSALILLAIVSTAGVPYTVLMPVVVAEVLHGGPNMLGILTGARGLARSPAPDTLRRGTRWSASDGSSSSGRCVFGSSLVAFSWTRSIWRRWCILLAIAGAGFMVQLASTNTIIQTIVDEKFRGRVMGFYTMAFFGTVPIGSLLAGVIAERLGAMGAIGLGAVVCIAAGAWFAYVLPSLRVLIRPIYIERGIIVPPPTDPGAPTP